MVMIDKIVAVRRERVRAVIGTLGNEDVRNIDLALFFVLGWGRTAD